MLINTGDNDQTFTEVVLPAGRWRLIADARTVDPDKGLRGRDARLQGRASHDLSVPAASLKIWVRE